MTWDELGYKVSSVLALVFAVFLISLVLFYAGLYFFYPTEQTAQVKLTDEQIQEIDAKYQQERTDRAFYLCVGAGICAVIGRLMDKPQLQGVALICLLGACVWDWKTVFCSLLFVYVIIPSLVVWGIISLFKRS
jgi:Na+/H+ antiporter NhaD/arsenite permease-like protein